MKFPTQLLIYIGVILLSPWWWIIIRRDFLAGLLSFILSIILSLFFLHSRTKALLLSLLLLTVMMIIINIEQGFDENILRTSALETQRFYKRHEFYGHDLGKLYKNRISLSYFKNYQPALRKLQSNFSSNLDLNLYFFTNHPRERGGIEEFEKYLPIFLPFFIIGFLHSIYRPKVTILVYIIIILTVSSLMTSYYQLGPILIFPIINYMISTGIILSSKFVPKILKK